MKTCFAALMSCLFAASFAVADDEKTEPINTICPVKMIKASADAPTTEYENMTVAFCCGGCAKKFEALSDKEKGVKLDAAATKGEAVNVKCPIMDDNKVTEKGGFVIYEHQKVGFCCEGCDKKWAKLSDKQKKEKLAKAKKPVEKK